MEPLGQFLKKRYGRTFGFALPIILGCVALGMLGNVLEKNGVSHESADMVVLFGVLIMVAIAVLVMFSRSALPGPLGRWQKLWRDIPTWKARRNEYDQTKKE
jgi:ABC-type proline/glycine betaine transport system permease subunit